MRLMLLILSVLCLLEAVFRSKMLSQAGEGPVTYTFSKSVTAWAMWVYVIMGAIGLYHWAVAP